MKRKFSHILMVILIILVPFMLISLGPVPEGSNFFQTNFQDSSFPDLHSRTVEVIMDNSYNQYDPAIAIGPNNISHCVWCGYDGSDYQIYYANSSDNFATKKQVTTVNDNWDPSITVDSSNVVHVAWDATGGIYYTNSSVNFGNHKKISQQTYTYIPDIACDSGIVHVVWEGLVSNNKDIYYANSTNYFDVNQKISNNQYDDEWPDINVRNNIVHVFWSKQVGNDEELIAYANSTDKFASERAISQRLDVSNAPRMAIDSAGNLHVVWYGKPFVDDTSLLIYWFLNFYIPYFNDAPYVPWTYPYYSSYSYYSSINFPMFLYGYNPYYQVYYSSSTNDFQTASILSRSVTSEAFLPDIVIDSNDVCHIVWEGETESYGYYSVSYYSKIFYTTSVSNFQDIKAYGGGYYNEHPRIANGSDDQVFCVFHAGDYNWDIYYMNGSDFQPWSGVVDNSWKALQLYTALPKMPDNTLVTVAIISILGGFNLIAILVHAHKKEKGGSEVREEKRKDDGPSEIKQRREGSKIVTERNGKRVKVKI